MSSIALGPILLLVLLVLVVAGAVVALGAAGRRRRSDFERPEDALDEEISKAMDELGEDEGDKGA